MKEKFYERTHQNKASNTKKLKNKKLKTKQKKNRDFCHQKSLGASRLAKASVSS